MKILITGGHITPALAVMEELERRRPEGSARRVLIVGRKYALDHEKTESFEYKTLKKKGIRFVNLSAGRLTRTLSVQTIFNLLRFPGGFWSALQILRTEKPDKILSFGGYIALPISLCAFILHIPVYTHEQTMRAGITNKIIGKIAQKVFISFRQSQKDFPASKSVLTGNPVRPILMVDWIGGATEGVPRASIPRIDTSGWDEERQNLSNRPTIYITGGSLGSHSINVHIENILDELLKTFTIIHQTGNVEEFGDYERLKKRESSSYIVKEHVEDDEIAQIYAKADIVISRSGANTVSELIVLQKPSVLIPLPWSSNGEQQAQAEFLQQAGVAEIFDQKNESAQLLETINRVYTARKDYVNKFVNLSKEKKLITQAAQVIVDQMAAV